MPHEEVEERLGGPIPTKPLFHVEGVQGSLGGIAQPAQIVAVAAVVRGGAKGSGLRQRAIIHDVGYRAGIAQKVVLKDIRLCGAAIAEPAQQVWCARLPFESDHGLPRVGAIPPEVEGVEELTQALGVARVELDGRRVQADDVKQGRVRVAWLAYPRGVRTHDRPIGINRPQEPEEAREVRMLGSHQAVRAPDLNWPSLEPANARAGR